MKNIIAAGVIALVTLSAGEAAAQETWQLAQINGSALPFVTDQDDDGCREEVVSGTLTLGTDGRWTLATNEREVCGDKVEEETEEEDGRFSADGDALRFTDEDDDDDSSDDDDDGDDFDDLANGTRAGNTLTVRSGDGSTTVVFQR